MSDRYAVTSLTLHRNIGKSASKQGNRQLRSRHLIVTIDGSIARKGGARIGAHVTQVSMNEPFLPFPTSRERLRDATAFRSTWLSSSLTSLREKGLYDRYLAALPAVHHDSVIQNVAGVWLPIEVAVAHYQACDSLGLSRRDVWDIGAQVTRKVHGTSLALAIRLAKQAGVTPWSILAQLQRLWDRVWQGGGICVHQRGPKEAIVEVIKWRCAGIPYVRVSMPAVILGVSEMFCRKAYVSDVPSLASNNSIGIKLQWA